MANSNLTLAERDDAAIASIQKLRFNPLAARGGAGLLPRGRRRPPHPRPLRLGDRGEPRLWPPRGQRGGGGRDGGHGGREPADVPERAGGSARRGPACDHAGRCRAARLVRPFRLRRQRRRHARAGGGHWAPPLHLLHRLLPRRRVGLDERLRPHGDDPHAATPRPGAAALPRPLPAAPFRRGRARHARLPVRDHLSAGAGGGRVHRAGDVGWRD